jgi:hypothetical protein
MNNSSLCIAPELHVAVNNIQVLYDAMAMQQWTPLHNCLNKKYFIQLLEVQM